MSPYTCREICAWIDAFAPPELALDDDNVGLHLGSYDKIVHRLFMALEISSPEAIREALDFQPDMIFVHHTPFYLPYAQMRDDDGTSGVALALIRAQVALYAAHTNLDGVNGGVNDVLAGLLDLEDVQIPQIENRKMTDEDVLRVGWLKQPSSLGTFAALVAQRLGGSGVRYAGKAEQAVSCVAVCGGAGAFLMAQAKARGADTFVTADVKHHEAAQAVQLGLGLIDGGHFATENPVIPVLAAYLREKTPGLTIGLSALSANPFKMV